MSITNLLKNKSTKHQMQCWQIYKQPEEEPKLDYLLVLVQLSVHGVGAGDDLETPVGVQGFIFEEAVLAPGGHAQRKSEQEDGEQGAVLPE